MYQLRKINLADSVPIYGRDRELFRPPEYSLLSIYIFIYIYLVMYYSGIVEKDAVYSLEV